MESNNSSGSSSSNNNNNIISKKQQNFSRIGNVNKAGQSAEIAHRKIPELLSSNNYYNNNKTTTRNLRRRETTAVSHRTLENFNRETTTTTTSKQEQQQQQQQLVLYDNHSSSSSSGSGSSTSLAVKNRNAEKRTRNRYVNNNNEDNYDSGSNNYINVIDDNINFKDGTNISDESANVTHDTSNKSISSTGLGEIKQVAGNSIRGAGAAFKQNSRFTPELNSVLSGRRKQNHNHLLNFHYAKHDVFSTYEQRQQQHRHQAGNGKHPTTQYNKENFLQANFQFVIRTNSKPCFTASPDALINWDAIEQINIETTEEPRCPICLYPPIAAKLTRCGHAYCWPCILHYLALHENMWCKCPICFEVIRMEDLKSTAILQQKAINVGDIVTLQLMHRKKSSLYIEKYTGNSESMEHFPFLGSTDLAEEQQKRFSKFLLARRIDINDIIEREQRELSCGMDDPKSPEFTYVQMALDLLNERRTKLGNINKEYPVPSSPPLVDLNAKTSYKLSMGVGQHGKNEVKDGDGLDEDMLANAKESYYFFYQSIDGQNVYLHPMNIQMLLASYGSLEKSPTMIVGRILQMEHYSMNDYTRRKFTCLAHLPLTRQFAVVEVDMQPPIITKDVHDMFCDEIASRKKERQRRQCEEFKREKKINELNDRQMGIFISTTVNLNITSSHEFPTCGFDIPLVQEAEQEATVMASNSSNNKQHASYSAALVVGAKIADYSSTVWPELANNNLSTASSSTKLTAAGYSGWATVNAMTKQHNTMSESDSLDDLSICGDQKIPSTTPTTLSDVLAEAISKRKQNVVETGAVNSTAKSKKGKKKGKGQVFYSNVINYGGKQ